MPYRNMTLEELARHLGQDARDLRRMAERGSLPGQMVGGQWRFNRAQMLDWLQREMHGLGTDVLRRLERAMADGSDNLILSALIAPEGVDMNLPARTSASVLRELVRLAERTGMVYDPGAIIEALIEREELCSTALPGAFAFPHPRRPLPYATADALVCVARVPAGLPFGAPDGGLTELFVLVCCHDERRHLQTLARLALLFSSDLPQQLRLTEDPAEALELILAAERERMRPPA